jgi:hypothetical protein
MTIQEILEFTKTMNTNTSQFFKRTDVVVGRTRGITVEKRDNGATFVHPNKSKRRYYRHGLAGLSGAYETVAPRQRDLAAEWRRKWKRVARECRTWGLWPEYADEIERGLEIGYESVRAAYAASCAEHESVSYGELQEIRMEEIRRIDERLVKDGKLATGILWKMNKMPTIARMNVGGCTEELTEAIRRKKMGYRTSRVRVGSRENWAEVSDKEASRAWYSREYIGCGNGSYYLIISPTHAVFYEND